MSKEDALAFWRNCGASPRRPAPARSAGSRPAAGRSRPRCTRRLRLGGEATGARLRQARLHRHQPRRRRAGQRRRPGRLDQRLGARRHDAHLQGPVRAARHRRLRRRLQQPDAELALHRQRQDLDVRRPAGHRCPHRVLERLLRPRLRDRPRRPHLQHRDQPGQRLGVLERRRRPDLQPRQPRGHQRRPALADRRCRGGGLPLRQHAAADLPLRRRWRHVDAAEPQQPGRSRRQDVHRPAQPQGPDRAAQPAGRGHLRGPGQDLEGVRRGAVSRAG